MRLAAGCFEKHNMIIWKIDSFFRPKRKLFQCVLIHGLRILKTVTKTAHTGRCASNLKHIAAIQELVEVLNKRMFNSSKFDKF